MSLVKISDDPEWQKITDKISGRMATLQASPVLGTMARLETSQVSTTQRMTEIEATLQAIAAKKTDSAWQAALEGDDDAVEGRERLRQEYQLLEQRVRFNEAALEEGRLEMDLINGKVCMEICHELKPDYIRTVVSKGRAAARALLEFLETDQRFIDQLLRCNVRIDHLGRVFFPRFLSRETLEAFLRETAELVENKHSDII